MRDQVSVNIFDKVQSLCRDFRQRLKRGDRKQIEDYVGTTADTSEDMLFQNLLLIDIDFRRRQSDNPSSDEYIERFPQFGRLIRQAFYESTMMPQAAMEKTPADEQTVVYGLPAARRLGEYELLREIGRGGFGVVYKARHLQRNNLVALKTLPTGTDGQSHPLGDAERLHKFRREFRSLAEINHPNLVGMQTLEVDGSQWFFTMDLLDGTDFLDYVRPGNTLDEQRLRETLTQLVQGIVALHAQQIVHRDLKPSNVLVVDEGRVVILDFGLVAELQQRTDQTASMRSEHFAGTPRYAAPEQAMGERTAASDWYAFGTMLYEALTGQPPFTGSKVELLINKQNDDAPLLARRTGVPQDLAALVDDLLQRDPVRRPDSSEIAERLSVELEQTSFDSVDSDSIGSDSFSTVNRTDQILIGRETQLADLEQVRKELLAIREPRVVFVSGRSGEGKTSLIERFLDTFRLDREMLVLSGRCYDRESVPFKAIDGQIDALMAFLRTRTDEELFAVLPDDIQMLAHLFPVLKRIEAIAERSTTNIAHLDAKQVRLRAFNAMKELLSHISKTTPIVMHIDDLQWGDADSATVLMELLSPPNAPAVILLGSYRSDEIDESAFLHKWAEHREKTDLTPQQDEIRVGPLSEEQCVALVVARLGQDDGDIRQRAIELHGSTGGNPYLMDQLLDSFDPTTGSFNPMPLNEVIDSRLKKLPADAAALLDVIAVSGQAVSINEVSIAAGNDGAAFATLTHMRSERLVRLIGSDEQELVDTYHDKIRETVLDQLEPSARRELHLTIGETIEAGIVSSSDRESGEDRPTVNGRVFDLAHHYFEADDPRAFQYQLQAGQFALDAYAMENAFDHLRKAQQLQPSDLDQSTRHQLLFALAKSQAGCNLLADAIQGFQQSLELAVTRLEKASCYYAMGEIHWKQSDYGAGLSNLRRGFAELGERLPQTVFGNLLGVWRSLFSYYAIPTWASIRLRSKSQAELAMLSQMYGMQNWMVIHKDVSAFMFATTRSCVIAKHVEDARVSLEAYSSFATLVGFVGFQWLTRLMIARATDDASGLPSDQQTGVVDSNIGFCLYVAGRLSEAEQSLNVAAARLARIGHYQQTLALHYLWHVWAVRGHPRQVVQFSEREEAIARLSDDGIIRAYAWYGQAEGMARQGETAEALKLASDSLTALVTLEASWTCMAKIQKARVHLQRLEFHDARQLLAQTLWEIPKLRFSELTSPTFSLFAEAVIGNDWIIEPKSISPRDRRKATMGALAGRLAGKLFPNNRPMLFGCRGG